MMKVIERINAANGNAPFSDETRDALQGMLNALKHTSREDRVVIFQILTDHYCPHCGIDQPLGDCHCLEAQRC